MSGDGDDRKYRVTIVGTADEKSRTNVGHAVKRLTQRLTLEQIEERLKRLPWSLTSTATLPRAMKLVEILEQLGAKVEVDPPIPRKIHDGQSDRDTVVVTHPSANLPGPRPTPVAETQEMNFSDLQPARRVPSHTATTEAESVPERRAPSYPTVPPRERPRVEEASPQPSPMDPKSIGAIIDQAFRVCRADFWKLAVIHAPPGVFYCIVFGIAAIVAGIMTGRKNMPTEMSIALIMLTVTGLPIAVILGLAVTWLTQGAIIHGVSSIHLGRPLEVWGSFRFAFKRFLKLFVSLLMTAIPISIAIGIFVLFLVITLAFSGALLTIPAGLEGITLWGSVALVAVTGILLLGFFLAGFTALMYLFVKLAMVDKVVMIEDIGYFQALKRSWEITNGGVGEKWYGTHWFRMLTLMSVVVIITMSVSYLFSIPGNLLAYLVKGGVTGTIATSVGFVLEQLGGVVGGMVMSVSLVIFYYDCRARKEGFDLQMLAESQDR